MAVKNVTVNEPFFVGHFPGHPIMPGVLVVEAMAQAGGVLLLTEFPDRARKAAAVYRHRARKIPSPGHSRRPAPHRGGRPGLARNSRPHAGQGLRRRKAGLRSRRHLPFARPPAKGGGRRARVPMGRPKIAMNIHPTAIVDASASIPASCRIGPYCIVGASVEMGEDCELVSHVVLHGPSQSWVTTTRFIPSRRLPWIRRM